MPAKIRKIRYPGERRRALVHNSSTREKRGSDREAKKVRENDILTDARGGSK